MTFGGLPLAQIVCPPGQQQAKNIAQVVAGISQQSQGAGQKSISCLHHNIGDVKSNPDRESTIVIRRGMTVNMIMRMIE